MTHYDYLLPVARKIIKGLAAKPGVHFADKEIAAQYLAGGLAGAVKRGEFPQNPDARKG